MTRSWPSCAACPARPTACASACARCPSRKPRFAWTLPRIDMRRVVLVAAPGRRRARRRRRGAQRCARRRRREPAASGLEAQMRGTRRLGDDGDARRSSRRTTQGARRTVAPQTLKRATCRPPTTRLNKYNAWLRVRVDARQSREGHYARDADRARLRRLRRVRRHEHARASTARHPRPAHPRRQGRGRRAPPRQARRGQGAARPHRGPAAAGERAGARDPELRARSSRSSASSDGTL